MSSKRNKVGAMRYKADYVEGAGSNRSGDRNKNKAGNMRIGHRNNKAGNVKATGKEQDSGHFTNDRGAEITPKVRRKKLKFLGYKKIKHYRI